FDQLAVIGLFHVVGAHPFKHVAEQAELPISIGGRRLCARSIEHDAGLGCDQRQGHACRRTEEYQGRFARHHPPTFWASFAAHHGPGSKGTRPAEYGLVCTTRLARAHWAPPPITATGSTVTTNCPKSNGYPFHPSEQDMISAAGIKDQELTIIVSIMLI